MQIKNSTKNDLISNNGILCSSPFSKFMGLMFSKKADKALIFKFTNAHIISLHMLFVFHPIDVLFLDKEKVVVEMKENFKPFTFYKSRHKSLYVVELREGSIKNTGTSLGDKIKF